MFFGQKVLGRPHLLQQLFGNSARKLGLRLEIGNLAYNQRPPVSSMSSILASFDWSRWLTRFDADSSRGGISSIASTALIAAAAAVARDFAGPRKNRHSPGVCVHTFMIACG
jgi:hypothetical protein